MPTRETGRHLIKLYSLDKIVEGYDTDVHPNVFHVQRNNSGQRLCKEENVFYELTLKKVSTCLA